MFSVLINTLNRCQKLMTTLDALDCQQQVSEAFEIVVVNDGSTDDTSSLLEKWQRLGDRRKVITHDSNRGPAVARNSAICAASGDVLVFLGDDIVVRPGFLNHHIDFHRRVNVTGFRVAVGYTRWAEHLNPTPFLEYINEFGPQFGYELLRRGTPMDWRFMYSSNLSLRRSLLDRLDFYFDERFTAAALEDIDLGYRLQRTGASFVFLEHAGAFHDHSMTIVAFCSRQRKVGASLRAFLSKHPELEPLFEPRLHHQAASALFSVVERPLVKALYLLDDRLRIPLPHFIYRVFCGLSIVQGFNGSRTVNHEQITKLNNGFH